MICVLYSKNLEPITVLKIPVEVQEDIQRKGLGKVPVLPPQGSNSQDTRYMWITPVRILMRGEQQVFFCTEDEELALTIKPEFLPGQLPMVQHMQTIIYQQQRTLKRLQGNDPV